jgi:hypothetical protein
MSKIETITIQVNGLIKRVSLDDYVRAKTKSLIEFGYTTLTEDEVRNKVMSIVDGEKQKDIIGMYCEDDIVRQTK